MATSELTPEQIMAVHESVCPLHSESTMHLNEIAGMREWLMDMFPEVGKLIAEVWDMRTDASGRMLYAATPCGCQAELYASPSGDWSGTLTTPEDESPCGHHTTGLDPCPLCYITIQALRDARGSVIDAATHIGYALGETEPESGMHVELLGLAGTFQSLETILDGLVESCSTYLRNRRHG